jgi:hypothetical protein
MHRENREVAAKRSPGKTKGNRRIMPTAETIPEKLRRTIEQPSKTLRKAVKPAVPAAR